MPPARIRVVFPLDGSITHYALPIQYDRLQVWPYHTLCISADALKRLEIDFTTDASALLKKRTAVYFVSS